MIRSKLQLLLLLCCLGYSILANENTLLVGEKDNLADPDLTPVVLVIPSGVSGASTILIEVTITELNNEDTDGSPILVRIPSDPRLSFSSHTNSDWIYLGDNGVMHTFTYNGPGLIISKGTQSSFVITATFDPQSTDGKSSITVTIVPFSGGDTNYFNSTDTEKLVYFG